MSDLNDLPEGWIKTKFSEITNKIVDGSHNPPPKADLGLPMLSARNIEGGLIRFEEDYRLISEQDFEREDRRTKIKSGDILLTIVGAIGRCAVVPKNIQPFTLQRSVAVLSPVEVDSQFLSYQLQSPNLQEDLLNRAKGTAQKGVYLKSLNELAIDIPPLNEQRRIVSTIEQLTDRSHKARTALENVPKLIAQFRQSVLAAAFRGDLTADWREKNPDIEPASELLERIKGKSWERVDNWQRKIPDNWVWARFADVAEIKSNLIDPSEHLNQPHIAPNHIVSHTGELLEYETIGKDGVTSSKHIFYAGQIIYSKIRPYLAKAVLVNFGGLCSADMYPIESKINSEFLHQWMICPEFTEMASGQQGRTVLPKINQKSLNELIVPVPPIDEQKEIVRHIKNMLVIIQSRSNALVEILSDLGRLDRSILAKAFRGELVPQDPNDEPAAVLLDRIRAEREQTSTSKQRGKTTRKNSSKQLSIDLE